MYVFAHMFAHVLVRVCGVVVFVKDGMFGKSDPYLKIKAIRGDGTVEDIADNKTPYKTDDENPIFDELYVLMHELCRGNGEIFFIPAAVRYFSSRQR